MAKSIRVELVEFLQNYNMKNDPATVLYLTKEDEEALRKLSLEEAGAAVGSDFREHYKHLVGVERVVWDSETRHCE